MVSRLDGSDHRDLKPYTRESAPAGSMSATVGTGAQPRHTDAAYFPIPPRYTVLQCLEPGQNPCPTLLWPLDVVRLRKERPHALAGEMWAVRGGGYSPFYCTAMEVRNGEARVRFDPLCMWSAAGDGEAIAAAEAAIDSYACRVNIAWEYGALLIIDNWTCLHARGDGAGRAPSRRLRRWYIGTQHGLGI